MTTQKHPDSENDPSYATAEGSKSGDKDELCEDESNVMSSDLPCSARKVEFYKEVDKRMPHYLMTRRKHMMSDEIFDEVSHFMLPLKNTSDTCILES